MRPELKIGLAAGVVVVLVGGVIWTVSNGRSGKQSDIPTNLKREDANSPNSVSLANDPSRPSRDAAGARPNVNTPYNSGANRTTTPPTGGTGNTGTPTPNAGTSGTGSPSSPGTSTPPSATDANRPRAETIIPAPSGGRSTDSLPQKPATSAPTGTGTPSVTHTPPKSSTDTVLTPSGGTPTNAANRTLPPSGGTTGGANKPEVAVPPKADSSGNKPNPTVPANTGNATTGSPRPGGSTNTTPPVVTTSGESHTVQSGDTLSSIAEQKLGGERYWPLIQAANPGLDPDKIRIGQKIKLPSKEAIAAANAKPADATKPTAPTTPANSGNSTNPPAESKPAAGNSSGSTASYEVVKGDTLAEIAKKALGDAGRWEEIFNLNRDQLPSPDRVRPGMKLKVPARKP